MTADNPIYKSLIVRYTGYYAGAAFVLLLWGFLSFYTDIGIWTALADSVAYSSILIFCAFYYWNIASLTLPALIGGAIMVIVQSFSLLVSWAVVYVLFEYSGWYAATIPIHLLFGVSGWYFILSKYRKAIRRINDERELATRRSENPRVETRSQEQVDILERITVKDGSQINIIKIEDLIYIQAYGDYVLLFTKEKKYIKEQTMKYFESTLPLTFVRIHRSYIINTACIGRVELSGKESYNVHLNNGAVIRASVGGYRLLKQNLGL